MKTAALPENIFAAGFGEASRRAILQTPARIILRFTGSKFKLQLAPGRVINLKVEL